ncbi:PREDICTED: uncharacterized protein LOC108766451 [Trachymyrmex cornetzi]|uniref:FLYWCH-type domain-containing protein n=1 Tax=Trachymyrmex cornetzi TaxID=471704 RepID=A0A151IYN8_9HYME|nr:PREDICTED: uncharacterized protein LOC108766451 [Trachymyrmex cornetzi]XP_018371251.1 PREDICTED: uncharacterized protein LOC108766451 [Trachymyrmex cornetzi]XP_018371252.1 PREDICTED: uncharacterized protein LOC108766451 [Trachymyrmex cornetzi]XP_018371253.1 PREDICTED: uncharacterized protein LOC108766451 [Trachymyrmex cornetzi]KYN13663.1 hypothetical protein ALC57_14127 [Trachymyrmex cornetzi]
MEIIPGKRKDSFIYVYEGYKYNIDKRYTHVYRCARRRSHLCSGVLMIQNEKFTLGNMHNHPSEPHVIDVFKLKREMIQMSKYTTATSKEIYDTISQKNQSAAANISYNAMKTLLSREKVKMRPPVPSNVCDLNDLLKEYEFTKSVYKSCIISEDNKYSYIFTTDKLLKLLEKSSEIYVNGTFPAIPKMPRFAKLFSVHVRYMEKGVVVLLILCEAKTEFVYNSIWKEIVKLVPNLQNNLRFIIMDYEKVLMNTLHKQFPQASLYGYWFHYCQAVLKKWIQLGLTIPHRVVSIAMALALAPPEMFSQGLNLMQIITNKECYFYPNMLLFMAYMKSTWLSILEKVCVYRCPNRTTNFVESFHNIMGHKMQTVHPNLWIFLNNVSKLIMNQETNYDRVINGQQMTKIRFPSSMFRNIKIRDAQNYLSSGLFSLEQFLQVYDNEMSYQQHQMSSLIDLSVEDEEIYADLLTEGAVNSVSTSEFHVEKRVEDEEVKTNERAISTKLKLGKKKFREILTITQLKIWKKKLKKIFMLMKLKLGKKKSRNILKIIKNIFTKCLKMVMDTGLLKRVQKKKMLHFFL